MYTRPDHVAWATERTALSLNYTLMPELMKSAGYHTHMVGKWHLGFYKSEYLPTSRGFDTYYGFLGNSVSDTLYDLSCTTIL